MLNGAPGLSRGKSNFRWKGLVAGGLVVIILLLAAVFWLLKVGYSSEPHEAPEAERILSAQISPIKAQIKSARLIIDTAENPLSVPTPAWAVDVRTKATRFKPPAIIHFLFIMTHL